MEQKKSQFLRLIALVLGITAFISLVVVIIGLIAHWQTPIQFSNGFFGAGALVIILGLLSVVGGLEQRGDFPLAYAETAGQASITERTQRMMNDINQRYGTMILSALVGALLIGVAIVVGNFG